MSFKELFKNMKDEILGLESLRDTFRKTKKTKSFKLLVTSIRKTIKDQIGNEIKLDFSNSERPRHISLENRIKGLKRQMELIFNSLGKGRGPAECKWTNCGRSRSRT